MIDYSKTLQGYHERMQKIALFQMFYSLDRKRQQDKTGKNIRYSDLLLCSLLFFFENMLARNYKTTKSDLADYLKRVCSMTYQLEDREYLAIAVEIIESLRPADGKKTEYRFFNFETEKEDVVSYHILKVSGWDRTENKQYYTLDEDGLELIFATKEFYTEFSLSISQLILRKQLEKGEFHSALRQIDEMRINVNSIKENMQKIRTEIIGNIISDDVYQRYKGIILAVNERLEREHIEFNELVSFVRETKMRYEQNMNRTEKERKLYNILLRVDTELNEVHNSHTLLLEESIELKTVALEAAREMLYHVGIDAFNFEQDIVKKIMTTPLPLESVKMFVKPFLGFSRQTFWSPVRVFQRQRMEREKPEEKSRSFFMPLSEDIKKAELEWSQELYAKAWDFIWKNVRGNQVSSKEVLNALQELSEAEQKDIEAQAEISRQAEGRQKKLRHRQQPENYLKRCILQFFLLVHHFGTLEIKTVQESEVHIFHKAFIDNKGIKAIKARALDGKIENEFAEMTEIRLEIMGEEES